MCSACEGSLEHGSTMMKIGPWSYGLYPDKTPARLWCPVRNASANPLQRTMPRYPIFIHLYHERDQVTQLARFDEIGASPQFAGTLLILFMSRRGKHDSRNTI